MKKFISLLLTVVMLTSCVFFTACQTEPKGSNAVKVVEIALTSEEYAFAVQKGDTELLASVNAFMDKIKNNGTLANIMNKYFGDGEPTAVESAATMKNDGSQLIVATNAAFEPFEYKSGNKYYGIDMEIMDLFAKEIGKELYIYNMEFDAVCLAVSAAGGEYTAEDGTTKVQEGGICDIAAAGLTVTDVRKEILDFSVTYYNASQMFIAAADDTTFDNCKTLEDVEKVLNGFDSSVKVGYQNGTTAQFYCKGDEDWGFAGYKFESIGYASGALAVQNIINGNVKYVIIDEAPAKAISARINEAN